MTHTLDIPSNFRYERKFTARDVDRDFLMESIRRHPALFTDLFHPRTINNIYLDTPSFKFYNNNKIGIAQRKKVRIRWYGSTFGKVIKPKLEYKLKSGLLGDKWVFDLKNFELESGFKGESLSEIFEQSNLPEPILSDLQLLQPSLLNSYRRSYFLTASGDFRLTFDEQMSYHRIESGKNFFLHQLEDLGAFILELKYPAHLDKQADSLTQHFPCRLNKSSKYVNGIDFLKAG